MRTHKRITIEDFTKTVNYFQRWQMGTTNKLLQVALQKQTHSNRQPELATDTCHHTVGEGGLGLN